MPREVFSLAVVGCNCSLLEILHVRKCEMSDQMMKLAIFEKTSYVAE
jgi:hypothetical protein